MKSKEVKIKLESGLDARPAAMLVQVARQYNSSIYLINGEREINAKSIMGMMALTLQAGAEVLVRADGEDEDKAIEEIEKYLMDN